MDTRKKCLEFGYRSGIARIYKTRIGCTRKEIIPSNHSQGILETFFPKMHAIFGIIAFQKWINSLYYKNYNIPYTFYT